MLNDAKILITGGTGSFGKAFSKTIIEKYNPEKIIIYSRDEFKQDIMRKELAEKYPDKIGKFRFFIGDVRDKDRLYRAFEGIDYVIHAAALKQVPACEYNPLEAIKTNINGAQNIVDAAVDCKVKKVVALSTDKAVNPINLYGGTKLVSDKLFVSANAYSGATGTTFSVVRYGNVAGSRGSVIPYFCELVSNDAQKLPITDLRMTRFWITLEQGIDLVFKAFKESRGGEIFIAKIPSFKVVDLAQALSPGCEMEEIGIREGEKLHEIMITKEDAMYTYEYENHYIIYPAYDWWSKKGILPNGKKLKYGFHYSSDNNSDWLSVEKIRSGLKDLGFML